jgi:hypothetical protein
MKFHPKCLWLHCKDHLKWLNNFFYIILVICSLRKIFNFVSYANITGVTSHRITSFQKRIVFLTNTYLKNLKIALVYVLISQPVINPLYLFVKHFIKVKYCVFKMSLWLMRCDVTPVIFAYETKLNILQRKQVTKIL